MSLRAAIADVRQMRAVQRKQLGVWRRYQASLPPSPARGLRQRIAGWLNVAFAMSFPASPMLIPMYAWFATRGNYAWSVLACLWVLLVRGHSFQTHALEFTANEGLRAPSKAGVLLQRLVHRVPWLVFLGGCLATAYAVRLGSVLDQGPAAGVLLSAIALSPVPMTIGKLRARLCGGSVSVLGPLLAPLLAATFIYGARDEPLTTERMLLLGIVTMAGLLNIGGLVWHWRKQPREHRQVAGIELASLPHALVGFGLLLPSSDLLAVFHSGMLAASVMAVVCLMSVHSLRRLLVEVQFAEESTKGSTIRRVDENEPVPGDDVAVALPRQHPGQRSLLRASLYLHRRTHWFRPGEPVLRRLVTRPHRVLLVVVAHVWGPLLALLAIVGTEHANLQAMFALFAGLSAPRFVGRRPSWALYRLGIDFRAQALHNLRALLLLAALPTLLTAAIAGTLAGWSQGRVVAIAMLTATFACRAGWRGLVHRGEADTTVNGAFLAATIAVFVCWLLTPPLWLVLLAAVIGAIGIVLRLRRLDEGSLAHDMRRAEELSTTPS